MMYTSASFIMPLAQAGLKDLSLVGGKNASLGEMLQHLSKIGIAIPDGFIITVSAYQAFLRHNGLDETIRKLMHDLDNRSIESLRRTGLQVRSTIRSGTFPPFLADQIGDAYTRLSERYGERETDIAVRSSATAEDLPDASFAGQQDTYLNVRGHATLLDAVRNGFASLFTDRAISYREHHAYDHFTVGLSLCVQKMVRSDLGASGVAFSLDTESGFRDVILINGSYGLGELLVQGTVSPDEFLVFKPTLKDGYRAIIEKKLGAKEQKMVYSNVPEERVVICPVDKSAQQTFCLDDDTILQLARWVLHIENYYARLLNRWCPMDIEWAVDGRTGNLFIVQARPETVHSRKQPGALTEYQLQPHTAPERVRGIAVGDKIACGRVQIMPSLGAGVAEIPFEEGAVLVTDMTDPDWEPIMKKAAAIVTNKGGRTCHAAIVAREMGVPAVVGCGNATARLCNGEAVTVSCAEGDVGMVYAGTLPFEIRHTTPHELPPIKTALMLNVGSPALAFRFAHLPHKGVGLAREEFIINHYVGIHPQALLRHRTLNDPELSQYIADCIRGFNDERDFFVSKLTFGIARIAAAFFPEKVIVRFSDFKSNEYCNLAGGNYFEPKEENPMIGWRGASRYYSPDYRDAFGMECQAIKRVRDVLGLTNVAVMIPFCRTVAELLKVKEVMLDYGLVPGQEGLELYLMAELPSNVLLAGAFAPHLDGFSIGSNDLTQLTLGLDRDSTLVAHLYDERNDAVTQLLAQLIQTAKAHGVKVGICGQGPSDYPELTQFLVEQGIDSISVTPDALVKTQKAIYEAETRLQAQEPYGAPANGANPSCNEAD